MEKHDAWRFSQRPRLLLLNLCSPFLACHQFYSHVRNIQDYITLLHYSFVDINGDI